MNRSIVAFRQDDEGVWVADLECGHSQHVRHKPPFFPKPWVLAEEGRQARIGTPLDCPQCDAGGETACYAHLLCPECGALLDGGPHTPGCPEG